MLSQSTLRQWFPTTVEEISAELERRLERAIHGRGK